MELSFLSSLSEISNDFPELPTFYVLEALVGVEVVVGNQARMVLDVHEIRLRTQSSHE